MEVFDANRIGKCIAWGGEHIVFMYGESQVLKFSLFDFFIGKASAIRKAKYDLEVCTEVFGEFLVPTRILRSFRGGRIAKMQPFVHGRPLRLSDLKDAKVAHQFRELLSRHKELLDVRREEIDFMGGRGALTGVLTNIFLTNEGSVRIIDALLISAPGALFWNVPLRLLRSLITLRQSAIIRRYLEACAA
jgi:hypothetical protein